MKNVNKLKAVTRSGLLAVTLQLFLERELAVSQ